MAIDTAAKRLAALHFGSVQPALGLPIASGTLDQYAAIGLYDLTAASWNIADAGFANARLSEQAQHAYERAKFSTIEPRD